MAEVKRLYRSRNNRMLGGICGGLEDYTNIDATIWRIIFILVALPGGISILVYFVLWLLIPEQPLKKDSEK